MKYYTNMLNFSVHTWQVAGYQGKVASFSWGPTTFLEGSFGGSLKSVTTASITFTGIWSYHICKVLGMGCNHFSHNKVRWFNLCGDYKVTVNPVLFLDTYPLPRADLFATLSGGTTFSKIDPKQAYLQMTSWKNLQLSTLQGACFIMSSYPLVSLIFPKNYG